MEELSREELKEMSVEEKPCYGDFLNQPNDQCDEVCDKDEQTKCGLKWKSSDKETERKVDLRKLPWYQKEADSVVHEGSCATNRGSCE